MRNRAAGRILPGIRLAPSRTEAAVEAERIIQCTMNAAVTISSNSRERVDKSLAIETLKSIQSVTCI